MQDDNLLSEVARRRIANKLRFTADKIEKGQVTPDAFEFEAEWVGKKVTGRIFLKLSYWTRALVKSPH